MCRSGCLMQDLLLAFGPQFGEVFNLLPSLVVMEDIIGRPDSIK